MSARNHGPAMLKGLAGLLWISLVVTAVKAEDIDRYLGLPDQFPASEVLILLDNSAAATQPLAWPAHADCAAGSSLFCYQRAVLRELGQELAGQPLSLGLLLFAGSGGAVEGGAYVRTALRTLTAQGSREWVSHLDTLNPVTDGGGLPFYTLALQEAYAYFQGLTAGQGHLAAADPAAFATASTYEPPRSACQHRHLIILSAATGSTAWGGQDPQDTLPLSSGDYQTHRADESARHLALSGITTHTVDIMTTPNPARSTWLRRIAREGRGHYAAIHSVSDLQRTLRVLLKDIPATSYGSAPVLPTDPTRPGFQLPQVYAGVFRPSATVRWPGNLKHYVMGGPTDGLTWRDANGTAALEADTGRFVDTARSFWTAPSDYWQFWCADARAMVAECGNPATISDAPDGAVVEKGGAGQTLRQRTTARNLFTCPADTDCPAGIRLGSTGLTRFDPANSAITPTELAVADQTGRDQLIAWVRGEDNTDVPERQAQGIRPSVWGASIHSNPVALDYHRHGSGCEQGSVGQDVVVFQASNAGVLHAVRGGTDGGEELWGFIPHEAWPRFQRLRDAAALINVPSIPLDENNMPYLFDGPLVIEATDVDHDCRYTEGVDSVWLFASLGRAGRALYAFDVTNPEQPRLMWRKAHDSSGFAELGQTWSSPVPVRVRTADGTIAALILGAGYDPVAQDRGYDVKRQGYLAAKTSQAGMGRGIFVLAAQTGEVLRQFGEADGLKQAIPSGVAVLRQRDTGVAYRGYVGDTGGTVWRIDLAAADPARWRVSVLARLGGTGVEARKFMAAPDVVPYERGYAVLLGSGDSEHPFETTVSDHFFMLRDEDSDQAIACESTIGTCELADARVPTSAGSPSSKGWFLSLAPGEQVRGSATTLAGTVYFSTHTLPVAAPLHCTPPAGHSRRYALNYLSAAPAWPESSRYREIPGVGTPAPVPFALPAVQAVSSPAVKTSVETTDIRGTLTGNTVQTASPSQSTRKLARVWWYRESDNESGP